MAKKVKKKARSGHTEKRVSTLPQKTEPVAQQSIPSTDDGFSIIKERKVCSHLDKGIDLANFSSRIGSIEHIRCEDCREGGGSVDKKPESKAIWVCLECGHLSCGEIGFPTTPQTHAVQHARQTLEKLEESGEQKGPLSDIVKLVKGRSFQGASVDVEDVYFGSGSVISEIKSENTIVSSLDGKSGYVVKGLVNIGNTCFFNPIVQNLLAMERLRNHFLELDESKSPYQMGAQPISRAKKPKLPPKRSGRIRPKLNRDVDFVASESVSVLSAGGSSSCQVESTVPVKEKVGDALVDYTLFESVGPSTVADKRSSVSSNLLTAEEFEKNTFLKNVMDKIEASVDNLAWLDYLEPDPVSNDNDTDSKPNDIAAICDSGKQYGAQNDALLQDGSLDNLTWLDYLEPNTLSDDRVMASKVNDALVVQDSGGKDGLGNSFENDLPLQVQDSEVLLLPEKEETSTSGEILREGVIVSCWL
ncbi:unnamed protein product [Camellia sinensis]